MAKRQGGSSKRPRQSTNRHYPRTALLNALLTEIIADHFERVDDDKLGFLTITGAEVDNDLNVCQVFVSTFAEPDPEEDAVVLEALAQHRKNVQRAIATQAKLRKTPDVVFLFDPAVRGGARIESILASLDLVDDESSDLPESDQPESDAGEATDQSSAD